MQVIKYFSILLWTKRSSCRSPAPGIKAALCPFRQLYIYEAYKDVCNPKFRHCLCGSRCHWSTASSLGHLATPQEDGCDSVPHHLLLLLSPMFQWLQWTFSQMHSRQRKILTFCLQQLWGLGIWTDSSLSTAQSACVLHMLEIHPLQRWNALWHHDSPQEESCGEVPGE